MLAGTSMARLAVCGVIAAWCFAWQTAAAQPYPVIDLEPGPGDAAIDTLTAAGDAVYFRRGGFDLWVSDGSAAGTQPLRSGPVRNLVAYAAGVAFTAPGAEASLEDVWTSDGTVAGTQPVAGIRGAPTCSVIDGSCTYAAPQLDSPAAVGGHLYLRASRFALWRSDGTEAGTVQLADYSDQVCSIGCLCCFQLGPDIGPFTHVNDRFFAVVDDFFRGQYTIERSDGGALQTAVSAAQPVFPAQGAGGRLFFGVDAQLGIFDGTVSALYVPLPGQVQSPIVAAGGLAYFVVIPGTSAGAELWRSDGTAAGTIALQAVSPLDLTGAGARLFFRVVDGGDEALWTSDGTAAGTVALASLAAGHLTGLGGELYFAADGGNGVELWRSDGTPEGTLEVADLIPGPAGSEPDDITAACGRLYFTAATPAAGRELWALDVAPGLCDSDPASCASDLACDDGESCTDDTCSAATGCQWQRHVCCSDAECADADPCTVDQCDAVLGCSQTLLPGLDAVVCRLGATGSDAALCPGEALPRALVAPLDRARRRIAAAIAETRPTVAQRRVRAAVQALAREPRRLDRFLARERLSPACHTALSLRASDAHALASAWLNGS